MARNAGFADFVGYTFKAKKRFDYSAKDCEQFHKSVATLVVPFLRREDARRQKLL